MSKFATIKVDELFYLRPSKPTFALAGLPHLKFQTHSLTTGDQVCKKVSSITYINLAEPVMGEVSYDPSIEDRIVTVAEKQAAEAPAAQVNAAPAPVKKAAAQKKNIPAKKGANKPAKGKKKAAAKKAAKKR